MGLDLDMPNDLERYQAMTTTREVPILDMASLKRDSGNVNP
jgi:hypothetical protein